MPPRPCAENSIFVSHTNDDPLADRVLQKLQEAYAPTATEDALELVWDSGSIEAGEDWRKRIYEWLEYCPAAILLISPASFRSDKPWVAMEAFFLGWRRTMHSNVLVIPVMIGGVEQQVASEPIFQPAQTREIEWLSCPDPNDETALDQVIQKIRRALECVRPRRERALEGLEKGIAEVLIRHRAAHPLFALALGMQDSNHTGASLAIRLAAASEREIGDAVSAFARYVDANPNRAAMADLKDLCALLCAREVPGSAARQLAIEVTQPPGEKRAVLINSTDNDVTDLYVVRSAGRGNHEWKLLDTNVVLDLGAADAARSAFRKTLCSLAGATHDPEKVAARAIAIVKMMRNMGRPVMFRMNVSDTGDAALLLKAVRDVAPECALLLRCEHACSDDNVFDTNSVCELEPPLGKPQWERLIGLKGALQLCCTPEES